MALVTCVECGKEFSDKALCCPICACPTRYAFKHKVQEPKKKDLNKEKLFSTEELKDYVFKSILPSIKNELNLKKIDFRKGKRGDFTYYILFDNIPLVAINLVLNLYPDIKDLFNANMIASSPLIKEENDKGYETYTAKVDMFSKNESNKNRRVFLKDDEYEISYYKLEKLEYSSNAISNEDSISNEDLKKLFGIKNEVKVKRSFFDFFRRKKVDDEEKNNVENNSKYDNEWNNYVLNDKSVNEDLFNLISNDLKNKISPNMLINLIKNLIDYSNGIFLKDSKKLEDNEIMKELMSLINNYEVEFNIVEKTSLVYYIYLYFTDIEKLKLNNFELIKQKRRLMAKNPELFGFSQEIQDSIKKEINENDYL